MSEKSKSQDPQAGKLVEIKDIRQLVKLMADNDLTELNIKSGDTKIHLRRGGQEVQVVPASAMMQPQMPSAPTGGSAPAPQPAPEAEAKEPAPKPAENLIEIKSPMVGTFYAAPSPESDSFVSTGAKVDEETVVCIVEAMKVMNEIKAECSGTIAEICVKNAQPVEFGQVLFRVKP
jgi:acetyl-CoA carboxylase biotin carboxyl carrier protein